MLRTTSGLSRPVLKWVSQVLASIGATLAATLIWSLVPHPAAAPPPPPELTSGGKFAARAVVPAAYDGLDTMPLPHVSPAPAFAAEPVPLPAMLHRAAWDGVASPAPERPARAARPARAPSHAEPRRAEPALAAAPVPAEPAPAAEDGFLHGMIPSALPHVLPAIASTARGAWTATAAAGDALVARVVPQVP